MRGPEEGLVGPGRAGPACWAVGLLAAHGEPVWVGVIYGAIDPGQDKKSPCCPAETLKHQQQQNQSYWIKAQLVLCALILNIAATSTTTFIITKTIYIICTPVQLSLIRYYYCYKC